MGHSQMTAATTEVGFSQSEHSVDISSGPAAVQSQAAEGFS